MKGRPTHSVESTKHVKTTPATAAAMASKAVAPDPHAGSASDSKFQAMDSGLCFGCPADRELPTLGRRAARLDRALAAVRSAARPSPRCAHRPGHGDRRRLVGRRHLPLARCRGRKPSRSGNLPTPICSQAERRTSSGECTSSRVRRGLRLLPRPRWLTAPACWVLLEELRIHLVGGAPWALLGSQPALVSGDRAARRAGRRRRPFLSRRHAGGGARRSAAASGASASALGSPPWSRRSRSANVASPRRPLERRSTAAAPR